jgi:hypothetical protein
VKEKGGIKIIGTASITRYSPGNRNSAKLPEEHGRTTYLHFDSQSFFIILS